MNKNIALGILLLTALNVFSQQENDTINKTKLKINGGFESNAQWYLNDKEREIQHNEEQLK